MNSKLKRRLSLLVSITMLGAALTGCATDNPTTPIDKAASGASQEKQGEQKSHTLTMLGQDPTNQALKWSERAEYPSYQEFEKLLAAKGITLEYEPVSKEQYKVVIQTRMASGSKLPDIANITPLDNSTALTLAKQGVIIELNEAIDKYSDGTINATINKYYPKSQGLTQTVDGKKYWFASQHYSFRNTPEGVKGNYSVYGMILRKDWLDKLNLPEPTTADEFYTTLKAFRDKDANGNGKADEVIVQNPKSFDTGIAQWFGLTNGLFGVDITNKKVVSPWYQEGVKPYFEYMQKLVADGIFDTTGFANIEETRNMKCVENQMAADFTYSTQAWYEDMCTDKNAFYKPIPPLKAVEGISPYNIKEDSTLTWQKYVITKACKDVEGAVALFDIVHSEKYAELAGYGVEGLNWDKDKNGVPTVKVFAGGADEQIEKRACHGRKIYAGLFLPIMQTMNYSQDPNDEPNEIVRIKAAYNTEYSDYEPWYADSNDNYLAMATPEENTEIAEIIAEATTYSEELCTKLILGQIKLSEFDSSVAKFKDLKLDRLLEIQQGRLDRYLSLIK